MMNSFYKINCAINDLKLADIENNYDSIKKIINNCNLDSILLFPLLSISGYSLSSLFYHKDIIDLSMQKLIDLSSITNNVLTIVSLPILFENNLYIGIAYLQDKKILGIYPKVNLNNEELKYFKSGKNIIDKKICINNSYIYFGSDFVLKDYKKDINIGLEDQIADIVLLPSCDNFLIGEEDKLINKYQYLSIQNKCTYIYVSNKNESATEYIYLPRSFIIQNGKVSTTSFNNNVFKFILDIDKNNSKINNNMNNNSNYNDLNYKYIEFNLNELIKSDNVNEAINTLRQENYKVSSTPFTNKYAKDYQKIIDALAIGLNTRCNNTNIYDLVMGISGGLDSTFGLIVLNKAQELNNKIKLHLLTLPYKNNTSKRTNSNANKLISLIKHETSKEIYINKLVDKHLLDIKHDLKDVTYENAQARMRTYILMNYANLVKGMVIGTGDLSEIALGFCTFNGDHISMYNLNASLPKTLIKECLNLYSNDAETKLKEVINSIISTDISPELQSNNNNDVGQKTEEQIGKYEINDFILYYVLNYGISVKKLYILLSLAFTSLTNIEIKKILKNFYSRFYLQQFKRNCSSDSAKVINYSLSPNEYKMPSDLDINTILKLIDEL